MRPEMKEFFRRKVERARKEAKPDARPKIFQHFNELVAKLATDRQAKKDAELAASILAMQKYERAVEERAKVMRDMLDNNWRIAKSTVDPMECMKKKITNVNLVEDITRDEAEIIADLPENQVENDENERPETAAEQMEVDAAPEQVDTTDSTETTKLNESAQPSNADLSTATAVEEVNLSTSTAVGEADLSTATAIEDADLSTATAIETSVMADVTMTGVAVDDVLSQIVESVSEESNINATVTVNEANVTHTIVRAVENDIESVTDRTVGEEAESGLAESRMDKTVTLVDRTVTFVEQTVTIADQTVTFADQTVSTTKSVAERRETMTIADDMSAVEPMNSTPIPDRTLAGTAHVDATVVLAREEDSGLPRSTMGVGDTVHPERQVADDAGDASLHDDQREDDDSAPSVDADLSSMPTQSTDTSSSPSTTAVQADEEDNTMATPPRNQRMARHKSTLLHEIFTEHPSFGTPNTPRRSARLSGVGLDESVQSVKETATEVANEETLNTTPVNVSRRRSQTIQEESPAVVAEHVEEEIPEPSPEVTPEEESPVDDTPEPSANETAIEPLKEPAEPVDHTPIIATPPAAKIRRHRVSLSNADKSRLSPLATHGSQHQDDAPLTPISHMQSLTPGQTGSMCQPFDEAPLASGPTRRNTRTAVRQPTRRSMRGAGMPQSPLFIRTVYKEQQKRLEEEKTKAKEIVAAEEKKRTPRRSPRRLASKRPSDAALTVDTTAKQAKLVDYDDSFDGDSSDNGEENDATQLTTLVNAEPGQFVDAPDESGPTPEKDEMVGGNDTSSVWENGSPVPDDNDVTRATTTATARSRHQRNSLYETGMSSDLDDGAREDNDTVRTPTIVPKMKKGSKLKRGLVSDVGVNMDTPPAANVTMLRARPEAFVADKPMPMHRLSVETLDSSAGNSQQSTSTNGERLNVMGVDSSDASPSPTRKRAKKTDMSRTLALKGKEVILKAPKIDRRDSSTFTPGVRRSRRTRVRTLDSTHMQRIEYENVEDEYGNKVRQVKGIQEPVVREPEHVKYGTVDEKEILALRNARPPVGILARSRKAREKESRARKANRTAAHRRGEDLSLTADSNSDSD